MYVVSCIPYWKYKRWALHLYVLSIILLIVVLTPLGTSLNNSQRWLFGFQPSEIAKLAGHAFVRQAGGKESEICAPRPRI